MKANSSSQVLIRSLERNARDLLPTTAVMSLIKLILVIPQSNLVDRPVPSYGNQGWVLVDPAFDPCFRVKLHCLEQE